MNALAFMEEWFEIIVQFGVLFLECIGVGVLLVSAVKALIGCLSHDGHVRLGLAEGIALALEFKLGGEVLRTAVVRTPSELIILGAIILLRGALTFLIHWEIKNEESKMDDQETRAHAEESAALPKR